LKGDRLDIQALSIQYRFAQISNLWNSKDVRVKNTVSLLSGIRQDRVKNDKENTPILNVKGGEK
jgi:hypothetical protein